MTSSPHHAATPDWLEDGLCAQTDPESYFPEKGGSTREAKAICNGQPDRGIAPCPVRAQCLQHALANDERFGIWGGLSERQRRAIQKGAAPMPVFEVVETTGPAIPTKAPTRVATPRLATVHPEKPAMPTPEPAQPSYADQVLTVLAATEGHADPDVRAARKVVANALVALNRTLRCAGGSAEATPSPAVPAPRTRSRGAGAQALRDRIAALGVEAKVIRAWAKDNGHDVPMVGMLPGWAVDLYERANEQEVAS